LDWIPVADDPDRFDYPICPDRKDYFSETARLAGEWILKKVRLNKIMKKILLILGAVMVIIVLVITIGKISFDKKVTGEVGILTEEGSKTPSKTFSFDDLEGLPEPVQRYFKYVLKDGQEHIKFTRLKQVGEFRMKENQPWMPVHAEQYFTTEDPAFIWRVKLAMAPFIWIEGRDIYHQGRGNMLIKLLSTITVADAKGSEMDISSLIRFLSEAPWFPTALLPGDYIAWEEIDSDSARVVIRDKGYTASGIFTFNEKGEILRFVTNDRYMEAGGKYFKEKWTAHYREYREFEGMNIPTEGEVEWNLSGRDLQYAKLTITDIQYNIAEKY